MSWHGLLQREDCADSLLVKFYKGDNTNDFGMSDTLSVNTNSYIVRDIVPNLQYTFQVSIRVQYRLPEFSLREKSGTDTRKLLVPHRKVLASVDALLTSVSGCVFLVLGVGRGYKKHS